MTQSQIFGCDEKNHDLIQRFLGTMTRTQRELSTSLSSQEHWFNATNTTSPEFVCISHQALTISITGQSWARSDFPFAPRADYYRHNVGIYFPPSATRSSRLVAFPTGKYAPHSPLQQWSGSAENHIWYQYCEQVFVIKRPICWVLTFPPHLLHLLTPHFLLPQYSSNWAGHCKPTMPGFINSLCFTKSRFVWDQYW